MQERKRAEGRANAAAKKIAASLEEASVDQEVEGGAKAWWVQLATH